MVILAYLKPLGACGLPTPTMLHQAPRGPNPPTPARPRQLPAPLAPHLNKAPAPTPEQPPENPPPASRTHTRRPLQY